MRKDNVMDDKFVELAERIATLEEQAEHGQRDRDEMKGTLQDIRQCQVHADKNLNELINRISKWEGKFGGVIFAVSCLWIFLTNIPETIMGWIRLRGG